MSQHGLSFFLCYRYCNFQIYWIKKEEKLLLLFFEGYQYSISNINKNSSVIKQKYSQAGYKTGAAKYTTYKGKKIQY